MGTLCDVRSGTVDSERPADEGPVIDLAVDRLVEDLYRQNWSAVVNYIRFRLEPATADDVAAESFMRAWSNRHQYDPQRGSAEMWLWGIVRHVVSDRLRRHDTKPEPLDIATDTAASVSDVIEARVELQSVLGAMSRLTGLDRQILSLRVGAGLSNDEIAEMLGLSKGNVAVRMHRAVKRLREQTGRSSST